MRIGIATRFVLASPAAAFVVAGSFTLRFAVGIITGRHLEIAQYLDVSPTALGVTLLLAAAATLAGAALLIRVLRGTPSSTMVVSAAASLIVAAVVAGAMMSIAWIHNAQGEIRGPGYIEWRYWFAIGLGWFLSVYVQVFLAAAVLCSTVPFLRRSQRRHAA